jgi:hypothetical protein
MPPPLKKAEQDREEINSLLSFTGSLLDDLHRITCISTDNCSKYTQQT